MGAAAVEGLAELGAEIHVLDLKDPPIEVASHQSSTCATPTRSPPRSRTSAGTIDALFNSAGLPGHAVPRPRHDAGELRRAPAPHARASCRT